MLSLSFKNGVAEFVKNDSSAFWQPMLEGLNIDVRLKHWMKMLDIIGQNQLKTSWSFPMEIMPLMTILNQSAKMRLKSINELPADLLKKLNRESIPNGASLAAMAKGMMGSMVDNIPPLANLQNLLSEEFESQAEIVLRYRNFGMTGAIKAENLSNLFS